jgi:cytochrome c2
MTMMKKWVGAAVAAAALTLAPAVLAEGSAESGKTIFSGKCSVCHSLGAGRLIGPDLKGVTGRREKTWLLGYIKDPDKYLATDPIAQELLKEYQIPMANLGLSDVEVADVVAYLETQV